MRIVLVLVMSLFIAAGAFGADSEGRFAVKGAGMTKCERFLEEWKDGSKVFYAYGGWIEGYLTATNQYLPQTYDITSWETTTLLAALLAEHCKKDPEMPFIRAVRSMVAALRQERLTESSELVLAEQNGKGVRLYAEVIRGMQTRLAQQGLYSGTVDGIYNDSTAAAVRDYQGREGIEQSGLPDQTTLIKLMRE